MRFMPEGVEGAERPPCAPSPPFSRAKKIERHLKQDKDNSLLMQPSTSNFEKKVEQNRRAYQMRWRFLDDFKGRGSQLNSGSFGLHKSSINTLTQSLNVD